MRLIGKPFGRRDGRERNGRIKHAIDRAMRPGDQAELRRSDLELLAESAREARGVQAMLRRPLREREIGCIEQIGREQIGPIVAIGRPPRHLAIQQVLRRDRIAFGQPGDRVGIGDMPTDRPAPPSGQRKHQHFGTMWVKTIEVALERAVDDDVSGRDAMSPGIARFDIAAGEHDRGEGPFMEMAMERFATAMAHAAWRRIARRTARASG
jgi:hypothetical protein